MNDESVEGTSENGEYSVLNMRTIYDDNGL